jgi:hypothetical protein
MTHDVAGYRNLAAEDFFYARRFDAIRGRCWTNRHTFLVSHGFELLANSG